MPAVVSYGFYAGRVGLEKSMPKIIDSKIFSANILRVFLANFPDLEYSFTS